MPSTVSLKVLTKHVASNSQTQVKHPASYLNTSSSEDTTTRKLSRVGSMRQIIEKNHHKSLSVLEDILERPTEGCEGNNLPTASDAH